MVGGKRVQFGAKINVRGVDPDSDAGRVGNFDFRMNLFNRDSQRGSSVNDSMFAKENDLTGRR